MMLGGVVTSVVSTHVSALSFVLPRPTLAASRFANPLFLVGLVLMGVGWWLWRGEGRVRAPISDKALQEAQALREDLQRLLVGVRSQLDKHLGEVADWKRRLESLEASRAETTVENGVTYHIVGTGKVTARSFEDLVGRTADRLRSAVSAVATARAQVEDLEGRLVLAIADEEAARRVLEESLVQPDSVPAGEPADAAATDPAERTAVSTAASGLEPVGEVVESQMADSAVPVATAVALMSVSPSIDGSPEEASAEEEAVELFEGVPGAGTREAEPAAVGVRSAPMSDDESAAATEVARGPVEAGAEELDAAPDQMPAPVCAEPPDAEQEQLTETAESAGNDLPALPEAVILSTLAQDVPADAETVDPDLQDADVETPAEAEEAPEAAEEGEPGEAIPGEGTDEPEEAPTADQPADATALVVPSRKAGPAGKRGRSVSVIHDFAVVIEGATPGKRLADFRRKVIALSDMVPELEDLASMLGVRSVHGNDETVEGVYTKSSVATYRGDVSAAIEAGLEIGGGRIVVTPPRKAEAAALDAAAGLGEVILEKALEWMSPDRPYNMGVDFFQRSVRAAQHEVLEERDGTWVCVERVQQYEVGASNRRKGPTALGVTVGPDLESHVESLAEVIRTTLAKSVRAWASFEAQHRPGRCGS